MKKLLSIFNILFLIFLSGCGCNKSELTMDQLAENGSYHYQNKDLGFAIKLPPEFEYYQTQRKKTADYLDIEFFVPTADREYLQEVPGYAKPIVIRIFYQSDWQNILEGDEDRLLYEQIGEQAGRVYTIKFWYKIPEDWKNRWNEEMRLKILEGFEII